MKIATATLESVAPYVQSRKHDTPKLERETADAYEARTWRNKSTTDKSGIVCIPGAAFKQAIDAAAKYLSIQVPGKGKATYTKHFKSGVLCFEHVPLGVKQEDTLQLRINANSDGVRGSGKRVTRFFPQIESWKARVTFHVLDEIVTEDIFNEVLIGAGQFIGIGSFRPENSGFCGRFEVKDLKWE